MTPQQRGIDLRRKFDVARLERVAQLGELPGDDGQKLHPLAGVVPLVGDAGHGLDHPQQPLRKRLPPLGRRKDRRQQSVARQPRAVDRDASLADDLLLHLPRQVGIALRDVGMGQNSLRIGVVERPPVALAAAVVLQFDEALDEGVGQRRAQRVAHRDVHTADLGRQGIEQRQQQVLVRQYHGRAFVERPPAGESAQDARRSLALHGVRHRSHRGELLRRGHVVVRNRPARRKLHDVLAYEHPRLLLGRILVVGVIVPIEVRLGSRRQEAEERLLAFGQGVEARHDVAPRLREGERPGPDPLGRRSLDHSSVGDAQLRKAVAQPVINRPQRLPDGQKAPLLGRKIGLGPQRRPELQDLQLPRRKVRNVGLELLDIGDVAEELVGIHGVFVDRVEVVEQHLAPEVELVEGLGVVLRVDLVELGDQTHAVPRMESRNLGHQVVDGHPLGLPHRPLDNLRQGVDEEEPRTPRRKEDRPLREQLPVAGVEIRRNLLQKRFHGWVDSQWDYCAARATRRCG